VVLTQSEARAVRAALRQHLVGVRSLHTRDLAAGFGVVAVPAALAAKYPNAPHEWAWQWVFPATRRASIRARRPSGATISTRR
jgi:hypothetical protein